MPDLKKMLTLEALSEALPSWLKRSTKPEYNADEIDSTLTTNQFVTASDKDNWNAKGTYSKPSGGIPKSDLSSIVQTSLEKADSALQSETDPTVPSWAKQTNKPSYTQDEVADGSTYKRVTQIEKDAWSGKQNALTTTQMQAVNSGITSEKVTQISKNQSSLVELEKLNGAKNLAEINDATFTRDMYIPCELKANTDYILTIQSFTSESSADTSQLLFYKGDTQVTDGQVGVYRSVPHGNNISKTIQIPADCDRLRIYSGSEGASSDYKSATFTHLMFIEKSIYDAGLTQYMPFGLSNSILTPALVECVDKGAKNLFNYDTVTIASSGFVIPNTTPMILAEGSYEISYTANQSESGNVEIGFLDANSDLIVSHTLFSQSGRNKVVLTIPIGKTSAYIYMFSANGGTFSDFMVCTELEAKITPSYQPYAIPNYELTKLESEDRAVLAEEIDAGAKNKLDFASLSNPTIRNATVTKTDSSIVVTSSGSYARAVYSFDLNAGTYKLRLSASDVTNESGSDIAMFVGLYNSSTITTNNELCIIFCTTAGDKYVEFNHAGGTVYIAFYINGSSTSYTNTYTISQMMICTEAAWKISPKFVPHRPDYDTLISMINAKEPALSTTTMDDGSLDDITVNSFIVCSWNVSSKPISTMGYVRTSVFDANSAMQEFYSFSGDETQSRLVYVRDKQAGVWRSWKMLTNNT